MTMPSSTWPAPGLLEPLQLQSTPALIADRLRSQILEGRFPPHTHLGEVGLARQLQVSRGPIREAMQRLIQERPSPRTALPGRPRPRLRRPPPAPSPTPA